ncbi:CtrA inhibitor SciP [Roseitranquillus sediminis]|uniref:CtrA inhibitor SciP n=1 Tax=Roseitranquillus sediminis TaxID=2809051 RepID=UPI001D0C3439|nr:DUF1153 domain-containing protein [Roseitranquillus sediminis]MBM9595630.1 DUF1153 domain-containing protein [Roseitranquillus sediminis]
MYLRKVDGPRAVTLPDGTIMTRADLPPENTRRWVASRKAAVVRALDARLIGEEEAMSKYSLSFEELQAWREAVVQHGEIALKATTCQRYRQLKVEADKV